MKKLLGVLAIVAVLGLVTAVYAHGPGGYGRGWGMGPGMMGGQYGPGAYGCPGFGAATQGQAITADQAKGLAQQAKGQATLLRTARRGFISGSNTRWMSRWSTSVCPSCRAWK